MFLGFFIASETIREYPPVLFVLPSKVEMWLRKKRGPPKALPSPSYALYQCDGRVESSGVTRRHKSRSRRYTAKAAVPLLGNAFSELGQRHTDRASIRSHRLTPVIQPGPIHL
ncbi:MAG: hypothetical protein QOE55_8427 [Acidobacteriaceae bacterium]|nr:hypothetical protein [Acidobacteriaceae bacterium]